MTRRSWFDYTYHSGHGSLWLRFGRWSIHFDADPKTEQVFRDWWGDFLPGRRLCKLWRWTVIVSGAHRSGP